MLKNYMKETEHEKINIALWTLKYLYNSKGEMSRIRNKALIRMKKIN